MGWPEQVSQGMYGKRFNEMPISEVREIISQPGRVKAISRLMRMELNTRVQGELYEVDCT